MHFWVSVSVSHTQGSPEHVWVVNRSASWRMSIGKCPLLAGYTQKPLWFNLFKPLKDLEEKCMVLHA